MLRFTSWLGDQHYKLSKLDGKWCIEWFHPEIGWVIWAKDIETAEEVLDAMSYLSKEPTHE